MRIDGLRIKESQKVVDLLEIVASSTIICGLDIPQFNGDG